MATGTSFVLSTVVPIVMPGVDTLGMEDPMECKDGVEVDDAIDCPGLNVDISLATVTSFISNTVVPIVMPGVDTLDMEDPIECKDGVEVDDEIDCTGLTVDISLATGTSFVSNTVVPIVMPGVDTLDMEDPIECKDGVEVDDEIDCTGLTVDISFATGTSFVSNTVVPIVIPSIDTLDMGYSVEYKDGTEVNDET